MTAEDILYAPLGARNSSGEVADFLIFQSSAARFDWKPMTSRARKWAATYFPFSYNLSLAHTGNDAGWMTSFSRQGTIAELMRTFSHSRERWLGDLVTDQFVLERVATKSV